MDTTTYEATVVHSGLSFGESPRWHDGRLWFSDFYRHGIFSLGDDGERREHTVETQPSGLGWREDGTLLAVSMTDCTVLAIDPDGTQRRHADLAAHCGYWTNEMAVAADGTAYVGNFGFNLEAWFEELGAEARFWKAPTTNLIVVGPDGTIIQLVPEIAFPNGTVLTPDGSRLILAETMGRRLTAFDVAADGTLSNRREFAELNGVAPDGICLDADGQVWVANAMGPECVRVAEGGEVTARMTTSQTAFACMLGGDDRRTLFAMTAPTSSTKEAATSHAGLIESARVAVPGAGRP
jgi:sugar lactone lactonase YvrE